MRAFDGSAWSNWTSLALTTTTNAPVVTAAAAGVGLDEAIDVSLLFSATDADGDTITQYQFWDGASGSTTGRFAINGVAQPAEANVTVQAANLGSVTWVGGSDPGQETVWARANDGTGWGAWTNWTMTTLLRYGAEVVGTAGADSFHSQPLGENAYFGLGGGDSFGTRTGDAPLLIGGSGNDSYAIAGINDAFVLVFETGNDPQDWIQPGLILTSSAPVLATVDSRHLLLGDADANRFVLVIDWQAPANRIETWFIGGVIGGVFTYSDMVDALAEAGAPNISIDELQVPGFTSAALNEMIGYYSQRMAVIEANTPPVVSPVHVTLRSGLAIAVGSLFSVADANGDAITRYEITDPTPGGGMLTRNGAAVSSGGVEVSASALGEIAFVGGDAFSVESLQVRAYDGLVWSPIASVEVTSQPNRAPVIEYLWAHEGPLTGAVPVASWFNVRDTDGDVITQYEFQEASGGANHPGGGFVLDGSARSGTFTVTAAEFERLLYVTSSAVPFSEQVVVRAFDGETWSWAENRSIGARALGNRHPVVRAISEVQVVQPGSSIPVAPWIAVIDPDGDAVNLQFTDFSGTPADDGHFTLNGVPVHPTGSVPLSAIAQLAYAADPEVPAIQAWSGDSATFGVVDAHGASSGLGTMSLYTTPNHRPTVSAIDANIGTGQSVVLSGLVGLAFTDTDGDPLLGYDLRDLGNGPTTGYFVLDGTRQISQQAFQVDARSLPNLRYVGGSSAGTETVLVRAITPHPELWAGLTSDWVAFSIRTGPAPSDSAGSTLATARALTVSSTVSAFDEFVGDGDALDLFRFDLATGGNLVLALTKLNGNADLQLLDANGVAVANSLNPENWSERISYVASAGTYYARVTAVGGHDTDYRFSATLV